MYGFFILYALAGLFVPPLAIVAIYMYIRRRTNNASGYQLIKDNYQFFKEIFFSMALLFLGVTLLSFNRQFGESLSWRLILLISSLSGFIISYYFGLRLSLLLSIFGSIMWFISQAYQWIELKDIQVLGILTSVIIVFLSMYSIGRIHKHISQLAHLSPIYIELSIIGTTIFLFVFSSQIGLEMIESISKGEPFYGSLQMSISVVAIISLFIITLFVAVSKKYIHIIEAIYFLVIGTIFIAVAFIPEQYLTTYEGLTKSGIIWALTFNLIVFVHTVGLIFLGYMRKDKGLINKGALFLFILILIKYFDWFFTFLDKSLFFIGAGLILFIVGWFMERGRRYMISQIKIK